MSPSGVATASHATIRVGIGCLNALSRFTVPGPDGPQDDPSSDRLERICGIAAEMFRPSVVRLIFHDPALSHLEIRAGAIHPETKAEREICMRSGGAGRTVRGDVAFRLQLEAAGPRARPSHRSSGRLMSGSAASACSSRRSAVPDRAMRRLCDFAGLMSEWPELPPGTALGSEPPPRR